MPSCGPEDASILVVGLAPGLKGANRTGIPFSGDASGDLLHATLDRLSLRDQVRITNAVKCLPIRNLPSGREVKSCSKHLLPELQAHACQPNGVVIALGGVAHRAILSSLGLKQKDHVFSHHAVHELPGFLLIDTYHCSRYNTQTGRLTPTMFEAVFRTATEHAAA
ncbi:MAG: uracil-DNA glycosylase [Proteobacteria bacterium]|nr:uracil-DNA glycosylase [Pseudomonadota bacterium]